jgi:regulator of RNase E activity RraA
MSRLPIVSRRTRKVAAVAGGVVGGLLVLDLIGFVATAYFSAELMQYAQRAGVAGLLRK